MLGKHNWTQNKVRNNTYTLSRDVGIFDIRFDVVRLVLVYWAGSDVSDISNTNVILKAGQEARDSCRGKQDKTRVEAVSKS
jgi:hypothetical protein